jgi:benzodiazapine receptor
VNAQWSSWQGFDGYQSQSSSTTRRIERGGAVVARSAGMSAIAPPPIGAENAGISTSRSDTGRALAALDESQGAIVPLRSATRPGRTAWLGSLAGLALFGLASAAAAIGGALVTTKKRNMLWYRALEKPSFTPPDRAFGLVWPVLYSLGALSAWRVARAPASKERSLALGLWATQLAFNAAWTPVFFGAHRPGLALATLAGNHASLSAYALAARKVDATAAWMVTPYLGWISFAGVLNGTIVLRNR